ncbi:LegC family aminotransferase [Campylobacter avium]|uniref:LegC family aminotransferase n=1 Tax=Campylobacter avium TaxID=522485 RepID=UPI002353D278|nr:LegC family aminotransferase [Campylobacter avium]
MFEKEISFIKQLFKKDSIALHEPCFIGKEKEYLKECIDSGFVSSAGKFVELFEEKIALFTGSKYAIATNSGTSALHIALLANGIDEKCEVITQSISFVATANAISYTGAKPIFLDISKDNFSLSPKALEKFLKNESFMKDNKCFNKKTKKHIKACVVMHSFGLSAKLDKITKLCKKYNIILIEDAAQALGSYYKGKHLGTFGSSSALSFNGNKIITGGCGGIILSNDEKIAKKARHLSTTAKLAHPYEYIHDEIGYNYRLSNVNAAILVAQLEQLPFFLENKRALAQIYKEFFKNNDKINFVDENAQSKSNFWLNAVVFKDENLRTVFLQECIKNQIYARAIYKPLSALKPFLNCQKDELKNTKKFEKLLVNLPSSVRL